MATRQRVTLYLCDILHPAVELTSACEHLFSHSDGNMTSVLKASSTVAGKSSTRSLVSRSSYTQHCRRTVVTSRALVGRTDVNGAQNEWPVQWRLPSLEVRTRRRTQ